MGWFWRNNSSVSSSFSDGKNITEKSLQNSAADDGICARFARESIMCETKKAKRGKYVKNCVITKEIHRQCHGKPYEVIQSNHEYTEEDVTEEEMMVRRNTLHKQAEMINVKVTVNVNVNAMKCFLEEMKSKVNNLLHPKTK